MNGWSRLCAAMALGMLAGCVGYDYPGAYRGGAYPGGVYPGGVYPGHPRPPYQYPGAGYGQTVRCESEDHRSRHCDIDTRGGVYLSRRLSGSPCIPNRTWGYDARGVWVTDGCRAEFTTGTGAYLPGYGSGYGAGPVVRCESIDGRWRHCFAPIRRGVQVLRTISGMACIRGQSWGWDRDGIWVDHGCRADFQVF
jgi:hypothetical protein